VVRWGSRNKHHKNTCLQKIGLRRQISLTQGSPFLSEHNDEPMYPIIRFFQLCSLSIWCIAIRSLGWCRTWKTKGIVLAYPNTWLLLGCLQCYMSQRDRPQHPSLSTPRLQPRWRNCSACPALSWPSEMHGQALLTPFSLAKPPELIVQVSTPPPMAWYTKYDT
jgi:hypothetical protein